MTTKTRDALAFLKFFDFFEFFFTRKPKKICHLFFVFFSLLMEEKRIISHFT